LGAHKGPSLARGTPWRASAAFDYLPKQGRCPMAEFQLTLSEVQRDLLTRMLSEALKAKRVEVHRTEFSREFRHQLESEEAQIQDLLNKLSQSAAVG
jgi:hypothetical protein